MEGYTAPDRSGGDTSLRFLAENPDSLVKNLFLAVTDSQITSAILSVNLVLASIVVFFVIGTFAKRLIETGTSGFVDRDGGLSWWSFRVLVAMILVLPAPDLSLGQRAVIGAALAGSGFADRISIAAGPARDAIRARLTNAPGGIAPGTSAIQIAAPSAQGAAIVAKIVEMRWCQFNLSGNMREGMFVPAVVERRSWRGARIWDFGPGRPHGNYTPDACGSIEMPMSAEAKANATRVGAALRAYSDIPQKILDAHERALADVIAKTGEFFITFPHHTRDYVRLTNEETVQWRVRFRDRTQQWAREYDQTVISAGGGTSTNVEQPRGATVELDPRWGWIRYGLVYHRRAQVAAETINALAWVPTTSSPNITARDMGDWGKFLHIAADDMRAAGLVPATPTESSGFDFASLIGVAQLRAALAMFSNPSADVFEVAGTAGPILTNIATAGLTAYAAASFVVPGIGSFVSLIFGTLLLTGQTLSLVLPLAPLVAWLFLILGWFSQVLVLLIALPFSAIAAAKDDEAGLWTSSIAPLAGRLVTLLFLPALLVLGLTLVTPILQFGWLLLSLAIRPVAEASVSGSALGLIFGVLFAAFFIIATLTSLIYFAISRVGSIAQLAEQIVGLVQRSSGLSVGERVTGGENTGSAPVANARVAAAPPPPPGPPGAGSPGSALGAGKQTIAASVPTRKT